MCEVFLLLVLVQTFDVSAQTLGTQSFDTVPQVVDVVEAEAPDDPAPRVDLRQWVVEVSGNSPDLGQFGPSNVGEVMMLVVVADIPGDKIQRAIVGVGLRRYERSIEVAFLRVAVTRFVVLVQHIVFSDKVTGTWVQRASQKGGHDEVGKTVAAPSTQNGVVHGHLVNDVQQMDVGEADLGDEHGTQGIEQDLESSKEHLAQDVGKHDRLQRSRQVCVQVLIAHELVVELVVRLERGTVGDADRGVGDDGKQLVMEGLLEEQVMRQLMDSQEDGLVRCGAHHVGQGKELGGEWVGIAEIVSHRHLEQHHKHHQPLCTGFMARKFGDFGVLGDDGFPAGNVGLSFASPVVFVQNAHGRICWGSFRSEGRIGDPMRDGGGHFDKEITS